MKRLKAKIGLTYPDASSLEIVREAGGLSKLTPEQRAKVKLREIKPGEWCDDVPKESREHLIEKGTVVLVQIEEPKAHEGFPRGQRKQKGEGK